MIYRTCFIVLLIICVCSCSKKRKIKYFTKFKTINTKCSKSKSPIELLSVDDLFFHNNNLIFYNKKNSPIFTAVNTSTFKQSYSVGIIGYGPNEFIYPITNAMGSYNNNIYILDKYKLKIYSELPTLKQKNIYIPPAKLQPINELYQKNDTTFCIVSSNTNKYAYYEMNTKNREITGIGKIPIHLLPGKKISKDIFECFMRNIAVGENGKTAILYSYLATLEIFDRNNKLKISKTLSSYKNQVFNTNNGILGSDTYTYYIDITTSDKYIIGLYLGEKISKLNNMDETDITSYLHFWDWTGKAIAEIPIKFPIKNITYGNDSVYMTNPFDSKHIYTISLSNLKYRL